MAFTPYDWNLSIQHRDDYVADRLADGSPVVGLRYDGGLAMVTVRRSQRKVFEIYDRLMFSALGSQSDIESVRLAAIDFAHQEGFRRSTDDVTIQRVVGFALSPALKRQFADPFRTPCIMRGLFAEMGQDAGSDRLYLLDLDGEFEVFHHFACAAGSLEAQARMGDYLRGQVSGDDQPLADAVRVALRAWAVGKLASAETADIEGPAAEGRELPSDEAVQSALDEALRDGVAEVGILERETPRESKFRWIENGDWRR
jgi:proteasome alpha subunit